MIGVSFFILSGIIAYPAGLLYRHSRGRPLTAVKGGMVGAAGVLTILMVLLPGFVALNSGIDLREFFMATAGVALGVGLGVATAREVPASTYTLWREGYKQGEIIAGIVRGIAPEARRIIDRHLPDEPIPWICIEESFIVAFNTAWYADYKESVRSMVVPVVSDEVWNGFTQGLSESRGSDCKIDLDAYHRHLRKTRRAQKTDRVGLWLVKRMRLEECTFAIDVAEGKEAKRRRKRVVRELGLLYMQAYTTHASPFATAKMVL